MEVGFTLEFLYFAFALDDEPDGHTLHTTCRKGGLHLAPKHGREFESHQAVEHTACLLGIHEVHVQVAGMLNGFEDGRLRDFMEHDAVCLLLVKAQHLTQMPRDGFSLTVFIGSQPDLLSLLRLLLQFTDKFALVVRYLVSRHQCLIVDADFSLFQVADVAITRHHFVILTQEFLDGLGFSRTLDNH